MTTTISLFSTLTITTTKTLTRTILTPTNTPTLPAGLTTTLEQSVEHGSSSLYPYRPSLPLAIIFTLLFFSTTVYHGYLSLYLPSRPATADKHRYTVPLFVAAVLSTLGYLLRCISIQKPHVSDLSIYATSMALVLISPIFICATLYLLLSRLITRCLPSATTTTPTTPGKPGTRSSRQVFLSLRPKPLSILFITSDLLSFLLQLLGAAILASPSTRGTPVLLTGLALQLSTFLLYLATLHLFCRRVQSSHTTGFNPLIWKVVVAVWIASGFVLVRSAFRIVEFAAGPAGYAVRHEWCAYVFDAFPVWVVLVVLGWWHPVKWVQERGAVAAMAGGYKGTDGGVVVGVPRVGRGHVRRRSRVNLAS